MYLSPVGRAFDVGRDGEVSVATISLRQRREAGAGVLEELEHCVTEVRRHREHRDRLIVRALEARVPVVDIARRAHVSRLTVYRIIESQAF